MRAMSRSAALLLLAALAACSPKPTTLEVEPSKLMFLSSGENVILITNLTDKEGKTVQGGSPCMFVTNDPMVADVRQDGTVTSSNSGKTEIRVTCGDLKASVPVNVSLPAKVTLEARCESRCVEMTADPLVLKLEGAGAVAKLSARIVNAAGEPVPVEPKWEIADPEFRPGARRLGVEISKDGELKSNGIVGRFMVLCSAGNQVARGSVEVVLPTVDVVKAQAHIWIKPGGEAQIAPEGFKRTGSGLQPVIGAKYSYTSNTPAIVKVADDGKLTAVNEGLGDVVVAAESGAFAQVAVTVSEEEPKAPPATKKK